ncbi:MAG: restriction endonuclease subunit S [Paludibacteraceae bacterium]|nr:restriction endonuclease subunit S [Paludibacteraceae bacterium]
MKTLEQCTWKALKIEDIFFITATKSGIDKNKLTGEKGSTPYITRTDTNNGWDRFIGEQNRYAKDDGNVISIGLDTQTVFYQPIPFYTGQNIQVLQNKHINKYTAIFMVSLLKVQMLNFNWGGNGATLGRLKRTKIMLPVTANNEPDWAFMEEYMKNKEHQLLMQYQKYITQTIDSQQFTPPISSRQWRVFRIEDIFTIQRGKRLKNGDHITGKTPYASSSAMDNGIDDFISNTKNVRIFANCLTIANSGSVGSAFYHPYSFVASDHVTKLENNLMNKYVYLFIAQIVGKMGEKYSFNREINDDRIRRETIMLPTTSAGTPDYEYMAIYMKNIETRILQKYIDTKLL